MGTKKQQGGKHVKHGRNARKPSTARRKTRRPELRRKARNVVRSCGESFARRWPSARVKNAPSHMVQIREGERATLERHIQKELA